MPFTVQYNNEYKSSSHIYTYAVEQWIQIVSFHKCMVYTNAVEQWIQIVAIYKCMVYTNAVE